ncbi:MAG: hypothetical protein JNM63_08575, partial [Spirochaetia bacterium]|nr:hypothetical protein [Spirochaetia bacterium]
GDDLKDYYPKDKIPSKFRFKFWAGGSQAEIEVSEASIVIPRTWKTPGTTLVKTLNAKSEIKSDKGIKVSPVKGEVACALDSETDEAGFDFQEKIPFKPKGVAMLDLQGVLGGLVGLEALCWKADGALIKKVDVFKKLKSAGLVEVPFDKLSDPIPADTAKISFRVRMNVKEATARIAGVFYGEAP